MEAGRGLDTGHGLLRHVEAVGSRQHPGVIARGAAPALQRRGAPGSRREPASAGRTSSWDSCSGTSGIIPFTYPGYVKGIIPRFFNVSGGPTLTRTGFRRVIRSVDLRPTRRTGGRGLDLFLRIGWLSQTTRIDLPDRYIAARYAEGKQPRQDPGPDRTSDTSSFRYGFADMPKIVRKPPERPPIQRDDV